MVAVGGDAVEVVDQGVAEPFHLGHSLPASRLEPAEEDPRHALAGLVGPEAIELLAHDVCFTQPPVGRKERRSFAPLRPSHGLPASQQQPALASTKGPHDGTCAKALLSPHVVQRGGGVLQDVERIEHDLRCRPLVRRGVDGGPMPVRTDRLARGALPGIEGMSRRLLKFGGGSGEILRDVRL